MGDRQQDSDSRPRLTERGRRRLTKVVVLSIVVLLLLLSLVAQSAFNLQPFVAPDTTTETLLLYALTTLNFLAFITVLFVLMRNVLKLAQERRAGRLGSKFKARLVSYAIGLSLLPVLLLFFFAFGLLNRSIDRWFGEPARQMVNNAKDIEESYFKKEEAELASIARAIARSLSLGSRTDYDTPELAERLRQKMGEYNLALAEVATPARRITVQDGDPNALRAVREKMESIRGQALGPAGAVSDRAVGESPDTIHIIAAVRVSEAPGNQRLLTVAREFPPELTRLAASIDEQHENFHSLLGKIKRIKAIYILLLAAVALLLIFAASWLALHVARGITVPIQALAEATDRVAHGDFARPVDVIAEDELAVLVNSFNQMSAQLAENRERLMAAAEDLRRTNQALDDRRRYIETVLESLSTGVISTDNAMGIATINRAAIYMLGLKEKPAIGSPVRGVIGGEQGDALAMLCRRARRSGSAQADIEFRRADGSYLQTATTAIALRNAEGSIDGWVIVIEDLTDLIQAERAAAWSEVARRMAHEIKNPLTPIQLSAERIMRNYSRAASPADPRFEQIVSEGTSTIVREVAALQRMVEEFSRFARLPEARPVDSSLNDVVRDAMSLYTERLDGIRMECSLASDLPVLRLDPEQMKRALVNLIDNAIEALASDHQQNGNGPAVKSIRIETQYVKSSDAVRLIVADSGHGIRPADRDKLFLPKFSTRSRGTGLGLAIVSHIVADHKGRIWVEDNLPRGARFIIEMPAGRGE